MSSTNRVEIQCTAAVAVPPAVAFPAIETLLKEFERRAGAASLALNLQQLHVPLEALISVPVRVHAGPRAAQNEWRLSICAASRPRLYPVFEGRLKLLCAGRTGSEIQLKGSYTVPLGAAGRVIDATLLRGLAQSSLHRFARDLVNRVAALSHWAALA